MWIVEARTLRVVSFRKIDHFHINLLASYDQDVWGRDGGGKSIILPWRVQVQIRNRTCHPQHILMIASKNRC
jgi:hypothetical protein